MQIQVVKVADIKPYVGNPRKNDGAVDAVAESIRQCGYCSPILVDESMQVLAGHTRLKAIKKLGWGEVEVCIKSGLTDEQKQKYRLLDNKTGELASWDYEQLEIELEGIDWDYDFGFIIADEIDDEFINAYFAEQEGNNAEKRKQIICPHCGKAFEK